MFLGLLCYRSNVANSGEVLEDGVGVSTDYYCYAHSLHGGWQGFSLLFFLLLTSIDRSVHAQDLKRLLFHSSVLQTIFLPDPGGGSFPVAV